MGARTLVRAVPVAMAVVLMASAAACGEGGSSSAGAEELSATLAIISTNIETAQAAGTFEPATEGEQLGVGDQVKTDPTGFAEITYHDGSWQRIENNATLTIDELTQSGDTNTVRTSIDIGQSWNRVQKLTEPDDAYELDTPVATATVRGTAFATDCPTSTQCTFSVIEGTVVVTPTTGDPVTLTAGQTAVVTAGAPPVRSQPGVVELAKDPLIAENLRLDDQDHGIHLPTEFSAAEAKALEGTYQLTTTVTEGNPSIPVGQTTTSTFTLTATCNGDVCTLEGDGGLGAATRSGDGIQFQGAASEPCPNDASIQVADAFNLNLTPSGSGLSGSLVQSTIDLRGCPNATISNPVTFQWEATRS